MWKQYIHKYVSNSWENYVWSMGINVVQNYKLTDCNWRISARWTVTQKSGLELAATKMSLAKQGV